ncbi:MAG: DivIVA domain-containing protein [Bacillota bacterium]
MPLTPLDIHNKEFGRAFRGYNEEEVDEFLDQVVREFESLIMENNALKEELARVNREIDHYQNIEETLNNTLIVAQRAADEVRANAEKEADLLVREAKAKADRLLADEQAQVRRVREEYESLQKQLEYFRAKMRGFLQAQLEIFSEGNDRPARESKVAAALEEDDN